jgi:outer membrane lipoprotein SlyB
MRTTRLAPIATGTALAALLAACGSTVPFSATGPAPVVYPTTVTSAPASLEFGRVTNIEFFPGGTAASTVNVPGAIVGAVAGAVAGNLAGRAIGGSSTRDAATVLGGAAGAAIGSQAGRTGTVTEPVYRITLQTEQGALRVYNVPGTGDLRIGDRVRVENGVIYRA